ncbi:hypothetical protein [Brumimicrobium aurantiacum]|uniref:Uncharacterized protein n=1 Tax=Brumimicrobium aurantiacum TaxID=1737063 RepID=A0A3E1EXG6_9FLAO|nr:hypothetical protein [Brumimicrobium aurantiacum]RFC54232.1 hypothetical protein DXU93_09610 [Brumimicrobium aurantiacum]
MKSSKFDFKKHQNLSKSWKMVIRFVIYSVVIAVLLFLIYNMEDNKKSDTDSISGFEIENIETE